VEIRVEEHAGAKAAEYLGAENLLHPPGLLHSGLARTDQRHQRRKTLKSPAKLKH
jgi:hypothetical protein